MRARRGHGGPSSLGGGAPAAAGGAERVRGELLSDAGGGDGVLGLELGSAGARRGAGGGGEGCQGAGSLWGPLSLWSSPGGRGGKGVGAPKCLRSRGGRPGPGLERL